MTEPSHEWVEHGADACLAAEADTLEELLAHCAAAMIRLAVPDSPIAGTERRVIVIEGFDREELLVGWLSEINALISAEDFLAGRCEIQRLEADGPPPLRLEAVLSGETVVADRHVFAAEIKAVTFNECHVRREGGRWRCRVVLDL